DCRHQLHKSMRRAQEAGEGSIMYLRGHEGRGIGLLSKLEAYLLPDNGLDTVDANLEQGLPEDAREHSDAGQILPDLGIESATRSTNNPPMGNGLRGFGVEASAHTPLEVEPNADNIDYLRTKRDRMNHVLPQVARWDAGHAGE